MKLLFSVSAVVLAFVTSSTFSGNAPSSKNSVTVEEKMHKFAAKLEQKEKRLAMLEAENRELRDALSHLRFQFNYAPLIQIQDDPALHLLPSTELRDLFTGERRIIAEVHQPVDQSDIDYLYIERRLDLIAPHKDREFKMDLEDLVLPDQK